MTILITGGKLVGRVQLQTTSILGRYPGMKPLKKFRKAKKDVDKAAVNTIK